MMFYRATEENYCQIFRNIRLDKEQDPNNIILEVRNNIVRWLQLAEVNIDDPKQMLEMFVIDAVLCNASKSLFSFLKERKIRTEKNLVAAIATFSDSHPELELDKRNDTGHFWQWQRLETDKTNTGGQIITYTTACQLNLQI